MKDLSEVYATTAEAAAWFRVTPEAIRKWVQFGKVAAIGSRGGHLTYRMSDLATVDRQLRQSRMGRPRKSQHATCG